MTVNLVLYVFKLYSQIHWPDIGLVLLLALVVDVLMWDVEARIQLKAKRLLRLTNRLLELHIRLLYVEIDHVAIVNVEQRLLICCWSYVYILLIVEINIAW